MADIILNPYYMQIASFILINIILGISIYITLSTGLLSLGSAGFMSIGAYTSALVTMKLGFPMPLGIVSGAMVAALAGILVGIPTLRLSGVYLAIATLGFGEVIRVWFNNLEITRGALGIPGIPQMGREITGSLREFGITPDMLGLRANQFSALILFFILLILVILTVWFFVRLQRSRIGRAYAAIKADEEAAEAMGINTTYYKVLAFAQGALVAGFAGALYAHTTSFINPGDFSYHRAVEILIFAVFGGSEVIWGPIFGAAFLTLMPEVLRGLADYRFMIYGVLLIVMMAFRPQGIIDYQVLDWLKKKVKRNKSASPLDKQKGGDA
ncbi:MAG: branched-chain amino acid ABC transporter permease [Bacillaceae bacterium]|nr:branched-chain amino acid ABC transporter permease [Bacillaceae bacterium]